MNFLASVVVTFLCVQATIAQEVPHPAIDGVFDEWRDEHIVANDPAGDTTGAFDVTQVSAQRVGQTIYLNVKFANPVNLRNGPESDGSLTFRFYNGHELPIMHGRWVHLDFRNRSVELAGGLQVENDGRKSWQDISFQCMPTHSSDQFELALNSQAAAVDYWLESLAIEGSDNVDSFALDAGPYEPDLVYVKHDLESDRHPKTDLRIANLNTWKNGLDDSKRGPSIARLVRAAQADIYCFQEEWDQDKFVEGLSGKIDENVNSVWSGGCAIATRLEIQKLEMTLDRAVAGLVTLPDGEKVAVISAHFKFCGYAGSTEDRLRIQQAEQLVHEIRRMRIGTFGDEAKDAPVVLIGDYNLVGSRAPLDTLLLSGLIEVLPRNPSDGSAYTWRGLKPDEEFWPGRLDLVSHGKGLNNLNAVVLDSERLEESELVKLGLNKDDSRASDHLLLITDFEFLED